MPIITEYLNEVKRLIDDAPLKLVPLNKGGKRGLYF